MRINQLFWFFDEFNRLSKVKIGFQDRKLVPGLLFIRGHLPLLQEVQFSRSRIDNYRKDTWYAHTTSTSQSHSWKFCPTFRKEPTPLFFAVSSNILKKIYRLHEICYQYYYDCDTNKRDLCGQSAGCGPVPIPMATQVIRIGGGGEGGVFWDNKELVMVWA